MWGAAGRNRGKGNCSWNVTYKRTINFFKRQKERKKKEPMKSKNVFINNNIRG